MSSNLEVVLRNPNAPASGIILAAGTALDPALLSAITDQQIETLQKTFAYKNKVENIDWSLVDVFGYEGFDPVYVYKHVLAVQASRNLTDADRDKDINYLLLLQVLRGNVSVANFKTFTSQGQQSINAMYNKWHLSLKITETEKKTAVTLPRISLAFPFQAALIAAKHGKAFVGPFGSSSLPKCFMTNSFASLIPIGLEITKMLIYAYNCHATDQSIALSKMNYRTMKGDELMAKFAEQLVFCDVAFQSTVIPGAYRLGMLKRLNVHKAYKDIVAVIRMSDKEGGSIIKRSVWRKEFKIDDDDEDIVGDPDVAGPS